ADRLLNACFVAVFRRRSAETAAVDVIGSRTRGLFMIGLLMIGFQGETKHEKYVRDSHQPRDRFHHPLSMSRTDNKDLASACRKRNVQAIVDGIGLPDY